MSYYLCKPSSLFLIIVNIVFGETHSIDGRILSSAIVRLAGICSL